MADEPYVIVPTSAKASFSKGLMAYAPDMKAVEAMNSVDWAKLNPVPVGNLIRLQVKPNRAMFLSYEGSLQPDLVGAGIIVATSGRVVSRDLGPSAPD